jgi:hypothetical protein
VVLLFPYILRTYAQVVEDEVRKAVVRKRAGDIFPQLTLSSNFNGFLLLLLLPPKQGDGEFSGRFCIIFILGPMICRKMHKNQFSLFFAAANRHEEK